MGFELEDGLKVAKKYGYKVEFEEIKPIKRNSDCVNSHPKKRVIRQVIDGNTVILTIANDIGREV